MERQLRKWAGCGLLMVLATAGCRSMHHSSVPPGRPFGADGRQQPSVGFSTDPHPANPAGNPALSPVMNMAPGGGMAGMSGAPQVGTPGVGGANYGVPGGAAFGAPGTSGVSPSLGSGALGGGVGQPQPLPGTGSN